MTQFLQILRKDMRQCRVEIVVLLAWSALCAMLVRAPWPHITDRFTFNLRQAQPLIEAPKDVGGGGAFADSAVLNETSSDYPLLALLWPLLWCALIARVVQADSLTDDRAFWLTRPYDRRRLWAAKAVFIGLFVNLPIFLAQASMLHFDGLPVLTNLPGLIDEQVLLTGLVVLPAMALAAVTTSLSQFVFLAFGALAGTAILWFNTDGPLHFAGIPGMENTRPVFLGGLGWVRDLAVLVFSWALAAAVLFSQFMTRRTAASRRWAVGAVVVGLLAWFLVPFSPFFIVQAAVVPSASRTARAEVVQPPPADPVQRGTTGTLDVGVRIEGLEPGTLFTCEAGVVNVAAPAGAAWASGVRVQTEHIVEAPGECRVQATVDDSFLQDHLNDRVDLRATTYLTVFGQARRTAIPVDGHPMDIAGVGRCAAWSTVPEMAVVICRAAFRWPSGLLWVRAPVGGGNVFSQTLSYSPFPAELAETPLVESWATGSISSDRTAEVMSAGAVAHLRLPAEAENVRLGDFEYGAIRLSGGK